MVRRIESILTDIATNRNLIFILYIPVLFLTAIILIIEEITCCINVVKKVPHFYGESVTLRDWQAKSRRTAGHFRGRANVIQAYNIFELL